jgi:hypothetical protein
MELISRRLWHGSSLKSGLVKLLSALEKMNRIGRLANRLQNASTSSDLTVWVLMVAMERAHLVRHV